MSDALQNCHPNQVYNCRKSEVLTKVYVYDRQKQGKGSSGITDLTQLQLTGEPVSNTLLNEKLNHICSSVRAENKIPFSNSTNTLVLFTTRQRIPRSGILEKMEVWNHKTKWLSPSYITCYHFVQIQSRLTRWKWVSNVEKLVSKLHDWKKIK